MKPNVRSGAEGRVPDVCTAIVDRRRAVILCVLALTAFFAVGATAVEESTSLDDFRSDSDEADALEAIEGNFTERGSNATTVQVVFEGENVLDRSTMLEILDFQSTIRNDEEIDRTLVDDEPIRGVPNAIAIDAHLRERASSLDERADELAARRRALNDTADELERSLQRLAGDRGASVEAEFEAVEENSSIELTTVHFDRFERAAEDLAAARSESEADAAVENGTVGVLADEYDGLADEAEALASERDRMAEATDLSIDEQRNQIEGMTESEVEASVGRVLGDENRDELLALVPVDYEPGSTTASATLVVIVQDTGGEPVAIDSAPAELVDAQLAIGEHAAAVETLEVSAVGHGITTHEIGSAAADSLSIVGPFALVFVVTILSAAYRDPIDVALGGAGVLVVLVWTVGFMGWVGFDFSIVFVGVVVLLVGLSIDFAIHLVMRVREARWGSGRDVRTATAVGLASVGVALVTVTITTSIGFLSNLVSPIGPIREFGLVSAVGIGSALVIFTTLVPALTVETDDFLESRGFDRRRRAAGTGGRLESLLAGGARLAQYAPIVVVIAVLLGAGGAYGATHVDTTFDTEEFLPEGAPAWVDDSSIAPETESYMASSTFDVLDEHFVRQDRRTHVLVEGDPTDPETLERVAAGEAVLEDASTVAPLANGEPARRTPLTVVDDVAAADESVAEAVDASDTTRNGLPDTDLERLYDRLYAADEAATAQVLSRSADGEYESLRLTWYADGDASTEEITDDAEAVADAIDGGNVTATPTGRDTVVAHLVEVEIVETVVESLLVTLLAVGLLLLAVFRLTAGRASLGVVAVFPVVLVLTWVLGTMALLDVPLNFITAMIASLTIGLGVDYSIHVTERFHQELAASGSTRDALRTTVTGTGGALVGSATTTAAGFGVLAFSFLPSLRFFGLLIALSIVYAFVASVLVLPSVLALWARWLGPERDSSRRGDD